MPLKTSLVGLKKLNRELPMTSNTISGHTCKESKTGTQNKYMSMHVQGSAVHSSQPASEGSSQKSKNR